MPATRPVTGLLLLLGILGPAVCAHADKIIMKDGKVYQGHIMGETSKQILISNPPVDPQPHFVPLADVLTIVHEGPPPPPPPGRDQLATLEALIAGESISSRQLSLDPTASLHVAGGLRPHAALEIGAQLDWAPAQTGDFAITDGIHTREYTRFETLAGGFYVKLFPAYRYREWRWQPYLLTGYLWNQLMPKATTDVLKGTSLEGGAGVSYLLTREWSLEARFVYFHTDYDTVNFLLREGSLNGNINAPTYTVSTGMAYRFL